MKNAHLIEHLIQWKPHSRLEIQHHRGEYRVDLVLYTRNESRIKTHTYWGVYRDMLDEAIEAIYEELVQREVMPTCREHEERKRHG